MFSAPVSAFCFPNFCFSPAAFYIPRVRVAVNPGPTVQGSKFNVRGSRFFSALCPPHFSFSAFQRFHLSLPQLWQEKIRVD
jgi:hypothetical protein